MNPRRIADLAQELGAKLIGDPELSISGVAGIREARPGDLTFLANPRYEIHLGETRASAVLIEEAKPGAGLAQLVHPHPYLAFLKAVKIFRKERSRPALGVHPTAVVYPGAEVGERVSLGPHVVIDEGAKVGDDCVVMAGSYVGRGARLGKETWLYPNVVVNDDCVLGERVTIHPGTVIGADGFGYVREGEVHHKVPQVGTVLVGDDVEIGANTCVDRATTGTTVIGAGTKIDNLVQVGHNVEMEENVIVVAQVGISGSTRVRRGATLAGQAGIAGHIEIGEFAVVASQAGVTKSVPPNTQVSGYPAQPHSVARRIHALTMKLPRLVERLAQLEQRLQALEEERSDHHVRSRS
jgi:UDP-3-O-[3-hydroxymyristoyl] glucosamine N-acyltransferase